VKKHTKDVLILVASKAVQLLIGFATLRIITELLSEKEVGIYYTLITVVNLLAFVFFNPLGQFYGRKLVHWQQTGNIKNATLVMIALRLTALPLALLSAIAVFYLFDYTRYFSLGAYSVFMTIALFALVHGVLLSAANILIGRVSFTLFAVTTLIVGLASSLILAKINETAMSWMYGLFLAQLGFSYFLYRAIVKENSISTKKIKQAFNKKYLSSVFFFTLPVTITLFLQWGQQTSFRLIVEDLYTAQALASIAVGMALSSAIFAAVESLATQFYMPIYLKKITNSTVHQRAAIWNQIATILIPFYISLVIFITAFAPFLTKVLVAEKFQNVYIYAVIGSIVELLRVSTNLVYLVSQSELNTKSTITPYLVGFTVMLVSLYSIDMTENLWKVPVALAFSYSLTLGVMVLNMKKLFPLKPNFRMFSAPILVTAPLLLICLFDFEPTLFSSLVILIFGGSYLMVAQYFAMRNSFKEIGKT
jgi:O-antigen/teichoic acid export membrane protein